MANVLTYVELNDGRPTPASLETLGQARRLGTRLGATVFTAVAVEKAPGYGDDDLLATLAAGGSDKIILLVGEALRGDPGAAQWDAHGVAFSLAWDACQPALALLPATLAGRELGARTASRVGAAFLHDAFVEVRDGGLVLAEGDGDAARILPGELDFPVVATLPPGRYAAAAGDEEAEVEVLTAQVTARFVEESRAAAALGARISMPASLEAGALPPSLQGADRVPAAGAAAVVELETSKGPLRIALGEGATQVAGVDFAAEGVSADLLRRLFTAQSARAERRR